MRISNRTCSINHGVERSARLVLCTSIISPRRGSNADYNRGYTRLELQDSHYIKKNRSGQYPVWLSIATINFLHKILAPGIPHLSKSAHFNAIDLSTSERPQYFTKVLARQQNYHYNAKITMQCWDSLSVTRPFHSNNQHPTSPCFCVSPSV